MASGQYRYFLLLSACLLLLIGVVTADEGDSAEDNAKWTQINNLVNPHVHQLGVYAVEEHNHQAKTNLKFHSLLNAEIQWKNDGTAYQFTITAIDAENLKYLPRYSARVWENLVEGTRKLEEFKRLLY